MATIVTRAGKGSPLSTAEMDSNLTNLNTDKAELSGAAFTGAITANAGISVDNFTLDGTTLALSSGDMTLDVAGDIILDADGGDIVFKDGSTSIGRLKNLSGNFVLKSEGSNDDLIFKGNDGGSEITALTLDMSEAGAATFSAGATFGGNITANGGIDVTGSIEIGGTQVLSASRALSNVSGNISMFTNNSGYVTSSGVTSVATGSGLTGGTITSTGTLSHADTSSQASVNNSGTTVIQDVFLDTFGHVTGLASTTISLPTVNDATLTLAAGSNISLSATPTFTANASSNKTITITSQDTNTVTSIRRDNTGTYRTGNINLIGGSGVTISETSTGSFSFAVASDTNTTYDLTVPSSTTAIRLAGSDGTNDDVTITGGTNVTVTRNSATQMTISATDTNTTYAITAAQTNGTNADPNLFLNGSSGTDTAVQLNGGTDITVTRIDNDDITFAHADTSSQASVNNSGTTVIQDVSLDGRGHVTGLGSVALNIPSVGNGTLTIATAGSASGSGTFTANQSGNTTITITGTDTNTVTQIREDTGTYRTGNISLVSGSNITISETSAGVFNFAATDTNTTDWRVANSGGTEQFAVTAAEKVRFAGAGGTSVTFNASTQLVTFTSTDNNTVTQIREDSGTYRTGNITLQSGTNVTISEPSTGVFNFAATDTNTDTTYTITAAQTDGNNVNPNLFLNASSGTDTAVQLNGGQDIDVTRNDADDITFSHSDTSSQASVNNSGTTVIQDVTLDGRGHVTGLGSVALNIPSVGDGTLTLVAGTGISLSSSPTFTANQSANKSITITNSVANTNTTYDLFMAQNSGSDNNPLLRLDPSSGNNDDITITGGTNVTVTRNSNTQLTIAATDTNTQYTASTGLTLTGTAFSVNTSQVINTITSSGFTLDSSGDITLDADGGDIFFKDGGSGTALSLNMASNIGIAELECPRGQLKFDCAGRFVVDMTDGSGLHRFELNFDSGNDRFEVLQIINPSQSVISIYANDEEQETILNFRSGSGQYTFCRDNQTFATLSIDCGLVGTIFKAEESDDDLIFRGIDGGSLITALTLDMSAAGAATFNNNVTAFSDRRLKKDIETLDPSITYKMRGVKYTRMDGHEEWGGAGVIAQEMEDALGDDAHRVVLTADDELGTKSVDYGRITGYLIETIKDLKAEVDELRDQVKLLQFYRDEKLGKKSGE